MVEVTAMQVAASADAEALGSALFWGAASATAGSWRKKRLFNMVKMLENHINVYLIYGYDVGSNGSNVGYDMVWYGSFIHMTGL